MIGNKQRMPKKARYPLFLIGLAVLLLGSILANSSGSGASSIGFIVLAGFVLMTVSVAIR